MKNEWRERRERDGREMMFFSPTPTSISQVVEVEVEEG